MAWGTALPGKTDEEKRAAYYKIQKDGAKKKPAAAPVALEVPAPDTSVRVESTTPAKGGVYDQKTGRWMNPVQGPPAPTKALEVQGPPAPPKPTGAPALGPRKSVGPGALSGVSSFSNFGQKPSFQNSPYQFTENGRPALDAIIDKAMTSTNLENAANLLTTGQAEMIDRSRLGYRTAPAPTTEPTVKMPAAPTTPRGVEVGADWSNKAGMPTGMIAQEGAAIVSPGYGVAPSVRNNLAALNLRGDDYWLAVDAMRGGWSPQTYGDPSRMTQQEKTGMTYDMRNAAPLTYEMQQREQFLSSPEEKQKALDVQRQANFVTGERWNGWQAPMTQTRQGYDGTFGEQQDARWENNRRRLQAAEIERGRDAGRISDQEYALRRAEFEGNVTQRGQTMAANTALAGQDKSLMSDREQRTAALDLLERKVLADEKLATQNNDAEGLRLAATLRAAIAKEKISAQGDVDAAKERALDTGAGKPTPAERTEALNAKRAEAIQKSIDNKYKLLEGASEEDATAIRASIARMAQTLDELNGIKSADPLGIF